MRFLKLCGRVSILAAAVLLAAYSTGAEAKLQGKDRAEFVAESVKGCLRVNKTDPIGKDMMPSVLKRVCTCAGSYAADRVTPGSMASFALGNSAEKKQQVAKWNAYHRKGMETCIKSMQKAAG